MNIKPLSIVAQEFGFEVPNLPFMKCDCRTYEAFVFQPSGQISATENGIRNTQTVPVADKYASFLINAKQSNVDLTITPEYSFPWNVLLSTMENAATLPNEGKLWVLGCESISKQQLEDLPSYANVQWVYDRNVLNQNGSFLDPLCYIFKTNTLEGNSVHVALLQFKTIEMADHIGYLERDHLVKGSDIYRIETSERSNGLCTLICSDAFNVNDAIIEELINTPTHLIHIQLNYEPRDPQFASYRRNSLEYDTEDVEILTLNWAKNTSIEEPYEHVDFNQAWGSAIYSKSQKVHLGCRNVAHNHHNGLFMCYWAERRTWAYYFDHEEAAFKLRLTPVSQRLARGQLSNRTGPEVLGVYKWRDETWEVHSSTQVTAFKQICDTYGVPELFITIDEMLHVVNIERLVTLSLGNACHRAWHEIPLLYHFSIDDNEAIKRITCALDSSDFATEIRNACLLNFRVLTTEILGDSQSNLPENLSDLRASVRIAYKEDKPNCNLYGPEMGGAATGIYLGDYPNDDIPRKRFDSVFFCLSDSEKRRLVVWFRCNCKYERVSFGRRPSITDSFAESNTQIASTFKPIVENN